MQEPETFHPVVEPVALAPPTPEQPTSEQEAPGAIKLRAEARESFGKISQALMEASQAGQLSDREIADFANRFAYEVRGRMDRADELNAERRAYLAEKATSTVLAAIDKSGVVSTVSEAHHEGLHPELDIPGHDSLEISPSSAVAA